MRPLHRNPTREACDQPRCGDQAQLHAEQAASSRTGRHGSTALSVIFYAPARIASIASSFTNEKTGATIPFAIWVRCHRLWTESDEGC
jgi:hypothetical protein